MLIKFTAILSKIRQSLVQGGRGFSGSEAGICAACNVLSFQNRLVKFSGLAFGTVLYALKFGVVDTPIDVDEDNQWKHDSEFV